MKQVSTILVVTLIAACGNTPSGGTPPTTPVDREESATPTVEVDDTTDASAAPAATVTASAPWFSAVVDVPNVARLHPIEGALLLAEETAQFGTEEEPRSGNRIGVVKDGAIQYPDNLFLEGWFHSVVALQGSYPDDVHMLAVGATGRTGIAEHYVLDAKKGWQEKRSMVGSWFVGVARVGRSLVGLTAPVMFGKVEFVTLSGPRVKLSPANVKACPEDAEARLRGTETRLFPVAMVGTSNGGLVAYGNDCFGTPALEVWKPGHVGSRIVPMPAGMELVDESAMVSLAAGVDGDVWLLPNDLNLYHYHNDGMSALSLPSAPSCSIVRVSRAGAVWTLCSGRAFERIAGEWHVRSTPNDVLLSDLIVDAEDTVWALGGQQLFRGSPPVVASTGSGPASVAAAPSAQSPSASQPTPNVAGTSNSATSNVAGTSSRAAPSAASASTSDLGAVQTAQASQPGRRKFPLPGGPRCENNVVVLYGFTKTTPLDYDFPMTRKALRGHPEFAPARFVVTRDVGQRFFAAIVPSYDLGKKLQRLIEKEVVGSKPQVVCAEPEVEREVEVDLSAGK